MSFDQTKFFLGTICKHNHLYGVLKLFSLRYKSNRHCVECSVIRTRNWKSENHERELERKRKWNKNNPDKVSEHNKKWRNKNRKYYNECCRKRMINWRKNNLERSREINNNWKQTVKGRLLSHKHNAIRRAKKREVDFDSTVNKELVFNHFNNQCCYCGSIENLQLEHIKAIAVGGSHTYNNLACACATCNNKKGAKTLFEWYTTSNPVYTLERFIKLTQWMNRENN